MKKNIVLSALLVILALAFSGCEKKKAAWDYLYNYSVDDIAGQYVYSNVPDAFEYVTEGPEVSICEDAELTIQKLSETTVQIRLRCPDEGYDQTFEGKPFSAENDYRIYLRKGLDPGHPDYEIHATVYANKKGVIRLHGYGRKTKYHPVDGWYFENWYFDVIKLD